MRRLFTLAASGAVLLAPTASLYARVGGGGGYSGGGGGDGGGGDAGLIFGLIRLLLWLVLRHPVIGIPLTIVVVIVVLRMARSGAFQAGVRENPAVLTGALPARRGGPPNLTPIRSTDPYFSEPVFIDFAQLVFARAQAMRGTGNREPLTAWMSAEATDKLFADRVGLTSVDEVIFGATRIVQAATESGFVRLDVEFDANVTETRSAARAQVLCGERWSFRRKAGVRSPVPERMRALGCPGCGSTLEPKTDGTCASCGLPRRGGASQWEVVAIPYANRRPLTAPELDVNDGGEERGTELPTVVDPRLSAAKRAFEGKHPQESWSAFEARVRTAFLALQQAWSTKEWDKARPFESDALFQNHRFWMERYTAFALVNRVEQVQITRIALSRIEADAFYESITVRIFASCLDWTEDALGKVVGGSKTTRREFTEYWTFLRPIPGSVEALASCPSCGAPLASGGGATVCASCGAKLVGGTFDWVASRIEQDDAYV